MSGYSPEEQEVLAAVGTGHGERRHLMDIFCYTQTFNSPEDVGRILRELLHRGVVLRQKNEAGKFCYWKPKGDESMDSGIGKVEEKPAAAAAPVEKKRRGPKPGFKRKAKESQVVVDVNVDPGQGKKIAEAITREQIKTPARQKAPAPATGEIIIQQFRAGLFTDGCLIMDMPGVGRLELTQQETRRIARLLRRNK